MLQQPLQHWSFEMRPFADPKFTRNGCLLRGSINTGKTQESIEPRLSSSLVSRGFWFMSAANASAANRLRSLIEVLDSGVSTNSVFKSSSSSSSFSRVSTTSSSINVVEISKSLQHCDDSSRKANRTAGFMSLGKRCWSYSNTQNHRDFCKNSLCRASRALPPLSLPPPPPLPPSSLPPTVPSSLSSPPSSLVYHSPRSRSVLQRYG
ncbi:MAG: hypothetical protein J3R72DRAFT_209739 [Linnemannia gamsii]|nr:MAG: hypothetical protein J3R72DRAFT_209739 [Linnemannia gamsii]